MASEWSEKLLGLERYVVPRQLQCSASEGVACGALGRLPEAGAPAARRRAAGAAGTRAEPLRVIGLCAGRPARATSAAEDALSACRTFACRSGARISLVSWRAAAPPLLALQAPEPCLAALAQAPRTRDLR